ncbi:hypothetical protein [Paenibacillus sp. ISL-20]|uniref:hypothetical protein n=1 Tax=Paenibacillus sp. ISL-20 TaxID=2819163 RepID=UPI001BEBEA8F|nr:hypothetical protein [Paenibacillus sp. ISL-20]MBT2764085.1 hypothetical protein [Paenibacillus sp. ISL-20]
MTVTEKIVKRFEELLNLGQQVMNTRKSPGSNVIGDDRVDAEIASQWATSTQNLIERVFGKDSVHLKNINKIAEKYVTYSPAVRILGILKAAKDDFEHDFLFDLKTIIEAEVFDDFLEQSEYLLEAGYFQPAAVITGCILEDGLRKLCDRHQIEIDAKPKLDKMNADLAKEGIYNKLTHKQITAFADLRNKAAHGNWSEFTQDDVRAFIGWVRLFMQGHFS